MLGTRPPDAVYDHVCYESNDDHENGPTTAVDPAVPPLGTAWYYVVTEEGICGEGPICPDSSGATRPNDSPCPTPT
ncbi:MAG: hypothetical protein O7A63_10840 [Acidobacteria bacterium]|nr:hypothetical protein [Acidobacteriota bacterium]